LFFGYKLHFVGRYSRKQRSSNFWFWEGGVPSSSISLNVDYGAFSFNLDNSRCTIKVWLYRNKKTPLYRIKF
jgi:ribosomal protein S3